MINFEPNAGFTFARSAGSPGPGAKSLGPPMKGRPNYTVTPDPVTVAVSA